MLYYLFDFLDKQFDLVGAGVFKYISFRAGMATAISLVITIFFGRYLINKLRDFQMGESIRDLGLEGQMQKTGTPTMGGIIIIAGIVIPTLLFAKLGNVYVQLLLLTAISMGAIGFLDDYLKIKKKNKEGLAGHYKIIGQVAIGLIVGLVMVMHPDVTIPSYGESSGFVDGQTINTTLPFIKNNVFKYQWFLPDFLLDFTWVIYVIVVIFIMTAVSNGANITDGLDGLAAGTSAIIGLTLAILAYLTGNIVFSEYLNIAYIPNAGELVIFSAAFVGACIGFLWYNSYPAQVFMGDLGSLALGGFLGTMAVLTKNELVMLLLGGVFVVEALSVITQVASFKLTGKRIFRMAPIHHHYELKGLDETKIIVRFWIVSILLAVLSLSTLKLR